MKTVWGKGGLFPVVQAGDGSHPSQDLLWDPENKEKKGGKGKMLFGDNRQNLETNRTEANGKWRD